jgi:potassium efflux system protein
MLDALDKATAARTHAEQPGTTPAQEQSELNAEFTRLSAEQKAGTPRLPEAFLPGKPQPAAARLDSMRDAIAAAKEALKETVDELESLRAELRQQTAGGRLAELKTQRDDLHQKLEDLAASRAAVDAETSAESNAEARRIAREKSLNVGLEIRVAEENLHALDATIGREVERSRLSDLRLKTQSLRADVGRTRLHAMQARYQALADQQRRLLETAAGDAQRRADRLKDPIEHFRAKRGAVLFALQAALLNEERELSATPAISSHEQERLTREASDDLENLRSLIEGGRSTTLVALRLTNSYRRIAQQREAIVGHELAAATAILTKYENILTSVELDILNDSREDRQEFEATLRQVPVSRRRQALEVFEQLEDQHHVLLESRRKVLTTLATNAEKTRSAILKRIGILDEQYAYIRTHIFWVRDTQPFGLATFRQCHQEAVLTLRAVSQLVRARWRGRVGAVVSVEFVLVGIIALILPVVLFRVRRLLSKRLARGYGRGATAAV